MKHGLKMLMAMLAVQINICLELAGGVIFDRPFAPQEGLVSRYEAPVRQEICLNGLWRFQGDQDRSVPGEILPPLGAWDTTAIKIPSPWNVNSFSMNLNEQGGDFRTYLSYPTNWEKLPAAWMEKKVKVPSAWTGKRILLHFGAVAGDMVVYVNGQRAGEGFDIFFAQEFDVTGLIRPGEDNQVLVKVISPKTFDKPGQYGHREYLSGSFWGTHIAGIWQDVYLLAEPKVAVSDTFVQPLVDQDELRIEATLQNISPVPANLRAQSVSNKSEVQNNSKNSTAVYLPLNGTKLLEQLSHAGVAAGIYSNEANADFLLLDGSIAPTADSADIIKIAVDKTLAIGGIVWVWNVAPAGAAFLTRLFGDEIVAQPRVSSSFVIKQFDPLLSGLDNAGLYFSESDDWQQMNFGLAGKFVAGGKALLEACPADWRRWNYQPEPVKTAALYRSEIENTSARSVIMTRKLKSGRVILCNIDPEITSTKKAAVIERMFRNEGIEIGRVSVREGFLDSQGRLVRALVCGSFAVSNLAEAYDEKLPTFTVKEEADMSGKKWLLTKAEKNGVFDFKLLKLEGPKENCFAYVAVWIKSTKPLNDLLSEPNLPKLSFTYGSDDGCELWLNGDLLAKHERHGPVDPNMFTQNPLLLKLGWNQLVIKVVQQGGEWQFAGKFDCSDLDFLRKLEFSSEPPAGQ
jgi:Glycosyl hydrolases family 2, sugar binding domain